MSLIMFRTRLALGDTPNMTETTKLVMECAAELQRDQLYVTEHALHSAIGAGLSRSTSWVRRIMRIANLHISLQDLVGKPRGLSIAMAVSDCGALTPAEQEAFAQRLRDARTAEEHREVLRTYLPGAGLPQLPGEWRKHRREAAGRPA